MKRLKDKSFILTGASKGIGHGIAKLFTEEGAEVLRVGRNLQSLERVQSEIEAQGGVPE